MTSRFSHKRLQPPRVKTPADFQSCLVHESRFSSECGSRRSSLPDGNEELEQDAASFLVDISDHSVERLIQLGVIDGESRFWYASEADVRRFVATAIEHAPPPSTLPPKDEALSAPKVDVRVKRTPRASKPDLLEVVFVNLSEINIALRCALVEWKRDGLDSAPVESSGPSVREVEGRVSLSPINSFTVSPGGECVFRLSDSSAEILLSILRLKIEDSGLCVGVVSTSGLGWMSSGPEVAADIRAVAQSVIATWDMDEALER